MSFSLRRWLLSWAIVWLIAGIYTSLANPYYGEYWPGADIWRGNERVVMDGWAVEEVLDSP